MKKMEKATKMKTRMEKKKMTTSMKPTTMMPEFE